MIGVSKITRETVQALCSRRKDQVITVHETATVWTIYDRENSVNVGEPNRERGT